MSNIQNDELQKNKVLIVDDDPDILGVTELILVRAGFTVHTYSSGIGVENAVLAFLPDLVLLDISLPDISGTEVCRQLKMIHTMPVIFFSAHSNKAYALNECNADDFIEKPFNMDELVALIKFHIMKFKSAQHNIEKET